ncbi:hypothetical protein BGX28_005608 [Mortierella sp. GBA30]|nr:hypothetical protein BGX28_005608 [Mortierella sp. GBA30]
MKMIMTQAELAQFGRLRAEMPRAPGPSTGAKPRQKIGFGTKANTGLESRPKIPSKLGIFVSTIEYPDHHQHANHRYQEQQKQQHHQRHSSLSSLSDKDENNEDSYENQKKSTKTRLSMPWTQSLSSLMSLSTNVLSQKKNKKSTTRKINKTSPLSLTFTWTTTQQQQQLQQQGEEEEEEQRQKYPRRSRSWYGTPSTCRRLDELELGESAMEEDNDVEEEDDEDEEQKEEEVEDEHKEEEAQVDWTALRRENNRSQRSTTHSPASVDLRLQLQQQQHQQQQQAKEERYEMMRSYPYKEYSLQQKQQQQQHRQQKTFAHQQTAFPSPVIIGKIVGTNKSKNARRRSGASTSTSSTYLSSPHMLSQSETSSSTHSVMPSLSSSSSSPWFLGSTWPFTETSGYSGFLMLSVFFCILYLFEGTNHFYNLQSALLSIVL